MKRKQTAPERRSEARTLIDKYFSVEFSKKGLDSIYQFKIWNISSKGMCIIVREDSDIINHLIVGDVLDMKYYPVEESSPAEFSKTEITHITKDDHGRFKGHYLVGLAILESNSR
ncbi:MAG: PilZ domain-containing protein [Deltaproteobacteria bacterium]|nr:PilZ domain-containing protein [Deltaproteobacteria bacterium]MBW2151936.1 PilZ domain-containing protein [Deltaproteobacteria bacterium]